MSAVYDTLTTLGYILKDYGNHYRTSALFREGTNPMSLAIRKSDGRFRDFGGKGQSGTFKELLQLIGGNPADIEKYIKDAELEAREYVPKQKLTKKKIYERSVLVNLLPHWDMYLQDGISEQTLRLFEVGLAQSGKLNRRYCFPIYNEKNEIIGFTGRWFKKDAPSSLAKWKHIGAMNEWVWPLHLNKEIIEQAEEIILVESPNCVLHMWEAGIKNVLCLFTIRLNPKLLKYLLTLPNLKRIVIATNNEVDNKSIGNNAASDIRKKLLRYFPEEKVLIRLPIKKDFAIMSTEEILEWHKLLTEPPNLAQ